MNRNMFLRRHLLYVGLSILLIVLIPVIFGLIPSRVQASLVASLCFWLYGFFILRTEVKIKSFGASFWGALQFLILAILPITILRLNHMGEGAFENAELFGVSGQKWHQFSRYSMLVVMVTILVDMAIHFFKQKRS